MIATFAIVLLFTMIKEAYEDYQRYKMQCEVNRKTTLILGRMKRHRPRHEQFVETLWSDIKAG